MFTYWQILSSPGGVLLSKTLCFLFGLLPSKEQTDKHPSDGLMCPAGSARGGLTEEQEHRTLNLMAKIRGVWLRLKQKV